MINVTEKYPISLVILQQPRDQRALWFLSLELRLETYQVGKKCVIKESGLREFLLQVMGRPEVARQ